MKTRSTFFIFSTLLLVNPLYADENSMIADLMLMPKKGIFLENLSINNNFSEYTLSIQGPMVSREAQVKVKSTYIQQSLSYSPVNGVNLGTNLKYFSSIKEETKYKNDSSQNQKISSKGIEDPYFFVKFRPVESAVTLDLEAIVSPKIINAKTGTNNKDGNVGRGATNTILSASIGQKLSGIQWSTSFTYDYTGNKETQNAETKKVTKSKSTKSKIIGAALQFRPIDSIALTAHGKYTRSDQKSLGLDLDDDSKISSKTFGVKIDYLPSSNISTFLNIETTKMDDINISKTGYKVGIKNMHSDLIGLGIKLNF